jgi:hypothetical protein
MNAAEIFVQLIEEMVDLKVQQLTEQRMRSSPELAGVLRLKQDTDRRRLDQIKTELARMMTRPQV